MHIICRIDDERVFHRFSKGHSGSIGCQRTLRVRTGIWTSLAATLLVGIAVPRCSGIQANTAGNRSNQESVEHKEQMAPEVEQRVRHEKALRLVAHSKQFCQDYPARALLLAIEAANLTRRAAEPMMPAVREQLYQLISRIGGRPLLDESPKRKPIWLRDGTLAYITSNRSIVIENAEKRNEFPADIGYLESIILSKDETWLVANGGNGISAWNMTAPDFAGSRVELWDAKYPASVRFDRIGMRLMALESERKRARVWKIVPTGFELLAEIEDDFADSVDLSPHGNWLVKDLRNRIEVWDLRTGPPKKHFIAMPGITTSLLVSPDDKWLVVAGYGFCRLWDLNAAELGDRVIDLFNPEKWDSASHATTAICFSPDAKFLITSIAAGTGHSEIWDLSSDPKKWAELPHVMDDAKFNSQQNRLLTLTRTAPGRDGILRAWDIHHRSHPGNYIDPRSFGSILPVGEFEISPTAETVATVDGKGAINLWDLDAYGFQNHGLEFNGHDKGVVSVEFSPDGGQLLTDANEVSLSQNTYSQSSPARVWDLGRRNNNAFLIERLEARTFQFVNHWIVMHGQSARNKNAISLWNVSTNAMHAIKEDRPMSSGGSWFTCGAQIWHLGKQGLPEAPIDLSAAKQRQVGLCVSPTGKYLARVEHHRENSIQIFELGTNHPPRPLFETELQPAGHQMMRFSNHEKWLIASDGQHETSFRLWDIHAASESPIHFSTNERSSFSFGEIRFADEERLVMVQGAAGVFVWEIGADEQSTRLTVLPKQRFVASSQSAPWLLTQEEPNGISLWDLSASEIIASKIPLPNSHVKRDCIGQFSTDGGRLVVTGYGMSDCLVWDLDVGNPSGSLRVCPIDRFADRAFLSNDGSWLVSGYNSNEAWLVGLRGSAPQPKPKILKGHRGAICEFKFSNDGRWLVTGGADEARLWDLSALDIQASSVELPITPSDGSPVFVKAIFSDDSRWLVTGASSVMAWDLSEESLLQTAAALAGRTLTTQEQISFQID